MERRDSDEKIDEEPIISEKDVEELLPSSEDSKAELWHSIGIHRPIASFWFNFVLLLIAAVPAIVIVGYVLPQLILPYPSALGFNALTTTYFALFFSLMDLATGPAIDRFVSEHAELRPRQALKYIQFFIWFQMFTGLIQVTAIAIFCFTYLVHTPLNYAIWFFILYSTTQYPGMLGTYSYVLKGFQRYDKENIVAIIQGVVFENITQVAFVLVGRWLGAQNPAIGEVMGATLGYIIGKYLDDFVAMGLAAYFVHQVLKPYGITLRETVVPSFGKEEVRDCLEFGLKLLGAPVISYLTDFIVLVMMTAWLPNYVAILGLIQIAKMIADFVGTRYSFQALLSESYNNGKKSLTQYAITSMFKHWWYLAFFLTLEIVMVMPSILSLFGGNYAATAWIIPIYIFPRLLVQPPVIGADILQACNKPTYRTIGIIVEKITKMVSFFLLLSPWGLPRLIGTGSMLILYIIHDIPAYLAITAAEFYFVHTKVVKLRIAWWQTFVAGTLASLPLIPINLGIVYALQQVTAQSMFAGIAFAAVMFLMLLMVFPTIIFFFYGLFGGWDERSLEHFREAVKLTGPSKPFVRVFFRCTEAGHKHSPLKNRFPIPSEDADREIAELMAMHYIAGDSGTDKGV